LRIIPIINLILFIMSLIYVGFFVLPFCLRLRYPGPLIGALIFIIGIGVVTLISFVLYFPKKSRSFSASRGFKA